MAKGRRIFKSVSVLMMAVVLMTGPGWNTGAKALAAEGNDVNKYAAEADGDASENKADASTNKIKRQPGDWGQISEADTEYLAKCVNKDVDSVSTDDIYDGVWVAGLPDSVPATGVAWKFASDPFGGFEDRLNVYDGTTLLREGADYRVKYKNNKKADSTAEVYIVGRGNYSGTVMKTFKITEPTDTFTSNDDAVKLKASMIKKDPDVKLVYSGGKAGVADAFYVAVGKNEEADNYKELKGESIEDYRTNSVSDNAKLDYVYQVMDEVKPGSCTVIITGINGYKGTVKKKFKIAKYNISDGENVDNGISELSVDIRLEDKEVYLVKGGAKPEVEVMAGEVVLRKGVDYSVKYSGNKKVAEGDEEVKGSPCVTVTGKGCFMGSYKEYFDIADPASVSDDEVPVEEEKTEGISIAKAKVSVTASKVYDGMEQTLNPEDITVLVGGTPATFEIDPSTYTKNVNSGTGSVKIRGTGEYCGSKEVKFKIAKRKIELLN